MNIQIKIGFEYSLLMLREKKSDGGHDFLIEKG